MSNSRRIVRALMPLTVASALGTSLALTVSEAVPNLDVEASCRAAAKVNRQIDLADSESTKNCMRDEEEARAELVQKWSSFSASDRGRCVGETMADGESPSYVDLLTCLQLTQYVETENAPPRGASKRRRKD